LRLLKIHQELAYVDLKILNRIEFHSFKHISSFNQELLIH
jgi:hypothetical protein